MTRNVHRVPSTLLLGVILLVALMPEVALSQVVEDNLLDTIALQYKTAAASWSTVIHNAALWLFFSLAVIEIAWTGITLALRDPELGEVLAEITYRVIFIGWFLTLLQFGSQWAKAIVASLGQIAGQASISGGGLGSVSPSDVFDSGISLAKKMWATISFWDNTTDSLGLILAGGIVAIVFALIAAKLLMVLVEIWITLYAGMVLLGFGASRFTSEYALRYFVYAFSVGLKYFVIVLIIGIGQTFVNSWVTNWSNTDNQVLIAIGVSVVLLALVAEIPTIFQNLVSGMSFSTGDSLVRSTGQVARGVAAAGAGAIAGGIGLAGGAAAVRNAMQLAQAQGASGVGGVGRQAAANLASAFGEQAGESMRRGSLAGPKTGMSHRMAEAIKAAEKELTAGKNNSIEKG